jgi:hypothetical protein
LKEVRKDGLAAFADDLFQFLGDDEIGRQDRQLLVNIAGAEAEDRDRPGQTGCQRRMHHSIAADNSPQCPL